MGIQALSYGDASSVESYYASSANTKNALANGGSSGQFGVTAASADAYESVKSSPSNTAAVGNYVNNLFSEGQALGAGHDDMGALNTAAYTALHGAGVSDQDAANALAAQDVQTYKSQGLSDQDVQTNSVQDLEWAGISSQQATQAVNAAMSSPTGGN